MNLGTFFSMHGYGLYVFPAYTAVIVCLFLQWFLPWRRLRLFLRSKEHYESNS